MPWGKKPTNPSKTLNPLIHGIYARDILLPGESNAEFVQLHNDLKAEFLPEGQSQKEAVLGLAKLHWQKRRLLITQGLTVLGSDGAKQLAKLDEKGWSAILKAARREKKMSLQEALSALGNMVAQRSIVSRARAVSDPKQAKAEAEDLTFLLSIIRDQSLPLLKIIDESQSSLASLANAYSPETMESLLRLEALIDARIDKTLSRLMMLKEFQRLQAGRNGP
jgi:hypothetical protein